MKKKILILSCHTGEGHNSAAKAIQEEARNRGYECDIENPLARAGILANAAMIDSYNLIIKEAPKAFGAAYKAGEIIDKIEDKIPDALTLGKSPLFLVNSMYSGKLDDFIKEGGYDAVICTHLYGMEAMTAIRKYRKNFIPCCSVLTDYTNVPFLNEIELDKYIISHQDLMEDFILDGFPREKLYPFGIPVASRFREHIGKKQARENLGIDENCRMYLIMTGGVGCGNIKGLCKEFLDNEDDSYNYALYILVGKNEDLKKELEEEYLGNPHIRLIAFTDKVNQYMEAADVMLSKAGGLSSTEAITVGVPLVHIMTLPGLEEKNAVFFDRHKMSYHGKDIIHAVSHAMLLAVDQKRREEMLQNQRLNSHPYSAGYILDALLGTEETDGETNPTKPSNSEVLNCATLDFDRESRCGFAEVIFCPGKADAHLLSIFDAFYQKNGKAFATRATKAQYEMIKEHYPSVQYDPISKIMKLTDSAPEQNTVSGKYIAVCTAGTADIPVAEEAAQTAEYFGCKVERIYDVGVSGIHRLLNKTEVLQNACCVVAVAGMEGALASVIGGLVKNPVIAVPTSVGYGACFEGLSALLTMINSCANGISVVNIDNGYGAGYVGAQICRLAKDPD